MNKMNLPAPFGQVTPTPPVVSQPMKKSMGTIERLKFSRVVEGDWRGIAVLSFFSSGILVILILICGIVVSFWLMVFGKRRPVMVLFICALISCLKTICNSKHSNL